MINDNNKNFLYLADTLPKQQPQFYKHFKKLLAQNKVSFGLIPNTNDIWCRDYMPVQNGAGEFIQFQYTPDYLQSKVYASTITNVDVACKLLDIQPIKSNLVLDGGNIVHYMGKVIMCDKVLQENPHLTKKEIIEQLRKLLRVNHVLLIPTHSDDFCGHADGILRFLDKHTVLINNFKKESPGYRKKLLVALKQHQINYIEIPYNTSKNKTAHDATGIYINFLRMKNVIFLPMYGLKEDEKALKLFIQLFPKEKIIPVKCNTIAKKGGVLNCITWDIDADRPAKLSALEKEIDRDLLNLGLEFAPDLDGPSPYSREAEEELEKLLKK